MNTTNNRVDGTKSWKRWFKKSQTRLTRPLPAGGFFNDGGGKQNPPREMLVAPPKTASCSLNPGGCCYFTRINTRRKGEKVLSLPGIKNNAIKNVGFNATIAGRPRVSVLPGHERIVKKFSFFDLPLAFLTPPLPMPESSKKVQLFAAPAVRFGPGTRFFQKVKLFKHFEDRPVLSLTSQRVTPQLIDGGGKGVRDISEEYYQTQRFTYELRATVHRTNEWRHIHRDKHDRVSQVLHKVVPAQMLWKSKVSLEPFQSIKQWVLNQCIHLTLNNDLSRIRG